MSFTTALGGNVSASQVKHKVEPITECSLCGGKVDYVNNREIYGRSYGNHPFAYWCRSCDAYVGVHPNTNIPLGTLADAATRQARKIHKPQFFNMIKRLGWSKNKAYKWLSEQLKIPASKTHWGMFDEATAIKAGHICRDKVRSHLGMSKVGA